MNKDILEKAVDTYGLENQLLQGVEECAEFIQAVNKWRRAKEREDIKAAVDHLAEEVADVLIMMEQAKIMIGEHKVKWWIDFKMNRLQEELNEYTPKEVINPPVPDLEEVIKTLKKHKYHHAAEIVREALKND